MCTPYPIVRINRVRINEVLLYIAVLVTFGVKTTPKYSISFTMDYTLRKKFQVL